VLLSPDIIQHLFMPLLLAANLPAVCSAWRNGWPQQLRTRRALRPVPPSPPVATTVAAAAVAAPTVAAAVAPPAITAAEAPSK